LPILAAELKLGIVDLFISAAGRVGRHGGVGLYAAAGRADALLH